MAQSRKDSRGYALRTGECQRSDGRYSYSYVDKDRKRQVVYAPDLITLRKKEQQIRRDLEDGLDPQKSRARYSQSGIRLVHERQVRPEGNDKSKLHIYL